VRFNCLPVGRRFTGWFERHLDRRTHGAGDRTALGPFHVLGN
jgi:hypothetical protein